MTAPDRRHEGMASIGPEAQHAAPFTIALAAVVWAYGGLWAPRFVRWARRRTTHRERVSRI